MQRLLKMANKDFTEKRADPRDQPVGAAGPPALPLSANEQHDEFIKQCARQLWTNAMILDGLTPEPEDMVARVQSFMAEAAEKRSPLIL